MVINYDELRKETANKIETIDSLLEAAKNSRDIGELTNIVTKWCSLVKEAAREQCDFMNNVEIDIFKK